MSLPREDIVEALLLVDALTLVIAAARKIERGCDCEYDHRCGRCQAVVNLKEAIERLDKLPTVAAKAAAAPTG